MGCSGEPDPVSHQRRLAIAGRGRDEGQLALQASIQPLDQARAMDQVAPERGIWSLVDSRVSGIYSLSSCLLLVTGRSLTASHSHPLKRKLEAEQPGQYHKDKGNNTDQKPEGTAGLRPRVLAADVAKEHTQQTRAPASRTLESLPKTRSRL